MAEKMSQKEAEMAIAELWKMSIFKFPNDDEIEV